MSYDIGVVGPGVMGANLAQNIEELLDEASREAVVGRQASWRLVVRTGVDLGIPVLALGAFLGYFDAYRSARLPANLIQAQRDYFGAHTYKRVDRPGVFHTTWQAVDSPGARS